MPCCNEDKIELCIQQGDDVDLPFRLLDSNGDPVDIAAYSFLLESSDYPPLDKAGTIVLAINGEFQFSYTAAETGAFDFGRVNAKLSYTVGGKKTTFARASVTLIEDE